ncbi:MAG: hypothetical protein J6Q95_02900 [Alistipes sp.]|nr:hypothetical protein [Alistipes sp.]
MKRMLLLMLTLAVVGIASCEKEMPPQKPENEKPQEEPKEEGKEIDIEAAKFVGMWTRTWKAEEDVQVGSAKAIYVWRFYKDYTGYLTIDTYDKEEHIVGFTRTQFTYKVENSKLYILYPNDTKPIEWDYTFEGDSLRMSSEMDEMGIEYVFHKGVDADDSLVGEWKQTMTINGRRVDKRLDFYTPTDARANEVRYNENGDKVEEVTHPREYKYTFDNSNLYLMDISTEATTEYTYRISGNTLYLKAANGDAEVTYTKFGN